MRSCSAMAKTRIRWATRNVAASAAVTPRTAWSREAVLHPEEAELVWTMINHAATELTCEPAPSTIDDSAEAGAAAQGPRDPSLAGVADLGWPRIRAVNESLAIDADTIAREWDGR